MPRRLLPYGSFNFFGKLVEYSEVRNARLMVEPYLVSGSIDDCIPGGGAGRVPAHVKYSCDGCADGSNNGFPSVRVLCESISEGEPLNCDAVSNLSG